MAPLAERASVRPAPIAAAIALAAPAITYRASARLDRDRWVREQRAETYIADLISQVREELKQGDDPWWRRWRPTRGRRVSSEEEPAAGARPA